VIEKFSGDDADDNGSVPQLRGCARGRAYRHRLYAPDRIKYPMLRDGRRGEGVFKRVSWDQALDTAAEGMLRIRAEYGPEAICNLSRSGTYPACLHNITWVDRLLNMFGGHTAFVGNLSNEAGVFAARYTFGTPFVTNEMDDLLNSHLILMWGWDPAVSIHSTNTSWYLRQAREKGTRIVVIDPRHTDSAVMLADRWIPVRPGTDTALLLAMANVILDEGLEDRVFLDSFVYGFQEFADYVTGAEDGVPKTPQWAEGQTGVEAAVIAELAREFATTKPAALMTGMGPGRTPYGEQFFRASAALAAMTGNIGIQGGSTGVPGAGYNMARSFRGPASPPNPSGCAVNVNHWADAILRGREGGYPSDIKMAYCMAGNLLNQVGNVNKGVQALEKLEFMVVHEHFITPTARFADVLFPATTSFEREDIYLPWASLGRYAIYSQRAVEPMYECRDDMDILTLLADRLGIEGFNDKTKEEWLDQMLTASGVEDIAEFKRSGAYRLELPEPHVALQKNVRQPDENPFKTSTGRIEVYSPKIAEMNRRDLPPKPKYIPSWESEDCPDGDGYPLLLITPQSKRRCHSTYDNIPLVQEIEPHTIWINPGDAEERGIREGDRVLVSSRAGRTYIKAKLTERIMPGVVSIEEGRWFTPGDDGVDLAGSANVLVEDGPSPAGAARMNTNRVEVVKA
jgi:anaerobic dimethyl sulfoxide reductase subunit A